LIGKRTNSGLTKCVPLKCIALTSAKATGVQVKQISTTKKRDSCVIGFKSSGNRMVIGRIGAIVGRYKLRKPRTQPICLRFVGDEKQSGRRRNRLKITVNVRLVKKISTNC